MDGLVHATAGVAGCRVDDRLGAAAAERHARCRVGVLRVVVRRRMVFDPRGRQDTGLHRAGSTRQQAATIRRGAG